jgi:hypothetical protein
VELFQSSPHPKPNPQPPSTRHTTAISPPLPLFPFADRSLRILSITLLVHPPAVDGVGMILLECAGQYCHPISHPSPPHTVTDTPLLWQAGIATRPPFHIAFPVRCLDETVSFYCDVLGGTEGRRAPNSWVDIDLFGHQLRCVVSTTLCACPNPSKACSIILLILTCVVLRFSVAGVIT